MQRACAYIESHLDESVTLAALGREVGVSPSHLQRTFKKIVGVSPKEFASAHRIELLKLQLKKGNTVTDAVYEVGYGSGSRVYETADSHLGMTPATYRRGGPGMCIRFTVATSPLGRLLVGATERGVCAVTLGDDDAALVAELRREYPNATLERTEAELDQWITAIVRRLSGESAGVALPLDLRATAFQLQVWKALQEIPYGSTRSYSEIAAAIGKPTAVRAVARACARNPVALVVPCHRVVREDGKLGGYRWGIERKRRLIQQERDLADHGAHEE